MCTVRRLLLLVLALWSGNQQLYALKLSRPNILKAGSACAATLLTFCEPSFAVSIPSVRDIAVSINDEKVPMKSLLGKEATLVVNFGGACNIPGRQIVSQNTATYLYHASHPAQLNHRLSINLTHGSPPPFLLPS